MSRSRLRTGSIIRWTLLLPVVLVGSMVFWTFALGLGGLSLLAVAGLRAEVAAEEAIVEMAPPPTAAEPAPGHAAEPITVRLEESAEPEDVNDHAGVVAPAVDEDSPANGRAF